MKRYSTLLVTWEMENPWNTIHIPLRMAEVLSKTNCTWQACKATTTGECKLKIFILSAKAGHSQIQMSQILLSVMYQ